VQALGHEFNAVIAEVGSEVDGWRVGQRVVVLPMISGSVLLAGAATQICAKRGSSGIAAVAPPEAAVAIPALLGGPPAAVIDCTGHPSGGPLAIELLAAAGRLTVVGMPDQPVPLDLRTLARLLASNGTEELKVVLRCR
jgi:threonine dehydrogenase-like Zn-dependent dehydrogenase